MWQIGTWVIVQSETRVEVHVLTVQAQLKWDASGTYLWDARSYSDLWYYSATIILLREVNRPGRSLHLVLEVKNEWNYASASPYTCLSL
jgi:hypothetical protein